MSHSLKWAQWLNMRDRRFYHSVVLFYDIIRNKSPQYLYNKLNFRTDVHTLNLRFKGLLTPPLHSTQLFKRSYSYTITKYFNLLSSEFKLSNKRAFRKEIFNLLYSKLFCKRCVIGVIMNKFVLCIYVIGLNFSLRHFYCGNLLHLHIL